MTLPTTEGYRPRSNVRTRSQDEPVSPERKARDTKRSCRARVSLPTRDGFSGLTSFECTQPTHSPDTEHAEVGRVRLRNNRTYGYTFRWLELDTEIWREEKHDSSNAG